MAEHDISVELASMKKEIATLHKLVKKLNIDIYETNDRFDYVVINDHKINIIFNGGEITNLYPVYMKIFEIYNIDYEPKYSCFWLCDSKTRVHWYNAGYAEHRSTPHVCTDIIDIYCEDIIKLRNLKCIIIVDCTVVNFYELKHYPCEELHLLDVKFRDEDYESVISVIKTLRSLKKLTLLYTDFDEKIDCTFTESLPLLKELCIRATAINIDSIDTDIKVSHSVEI